MIIYGVIVNYNGGDQIVRSVERLLANHVPIIVVDNASTDGSLKIIQNKYGQNIEIIGNAENYGFAAAANQAIEFALKKGTDKIFLVNPDTEITPSLINKLSNYNDHIVSPLIKFKINGQTKYDHGGKIKWLYGRTYHLETDKAKMIDDKIDYVSGCAMLIDRAVFHKIGNFDERYFLYFEDVDFCLRAKKAGFKIKVANNAVINHHLVQGKAKKRKQQLMHLKSNLLFVNKYYPAHRRFIPYLYLGLLYIKISAR